MSIYSGMPFCDLPLVQALGAGVGSWISVSLGAAGIFLRRDFSRRFMDIILGVAGGMMLGAAFWSLLLPSLEMSRHLGRLAFLPPVAGLALGAVCLLILDRLLPHVHPSSGEAEGLSTSWRRSVLLVTAMALHHIPEGLAIGVGYGTAGLTENIALSSVWVLTASILLQNLPEGLVVSTALRAEGFSAGRAWFYGMLSGATAPLGAVLGIPAATAMAAILPIAPAFAAGAMIYVVVEEVIPGANASGNGNAATLACIGGVALVLCLDVLVG